MSTSNLLCISNSLYGVQHQETSGSRLSQSTDRSQVYDHPRSTFHYPQADQPIYRPPSVPLHVDTRVHGEQPNIAFKPMRDCRYGDSTMAADQSIHDPRAIGISSNQNDHPLQGHCWFKEAETSHCDINKDIRQFAEQFRLRRMRLGATQADVGAALAHLRLTSTPLSQSTVCRFESMTLSRNNMQALRPALAAWLTAAESRRAAEIRDGADQRQRLWATANGRRRRRTTIAEPERHSLEAYFAAESRPSSDRITQIANTLQLIG